MTKRTYRLWRIWRKTWALCKILQKTRIAGKRTIRGQLCRKGKDVEDLDTIFAKLCLNGNLYHFFYFFYFFSSEINHLLTALAKRKLTSLFHSEKNYSQAGFAILNLLQFIVLHFSKSWGFMCEAQL